MAVPQPADRGTYDRSSESGAFPAAANDPRFVQRPNLRVTNVTNTTRPDTTQRTVVRRTSADRSDLRGPTVTRNVRVSTMPGSHKEVGDSGHKTTDQQFTESYAKAGLQPSSLDDIPPGANQRQYDAVPQITRSAGGRESTASVPAGVSNEQLQYRQAAGQASFLKKAMRSKVSLAKTNAAHIKAAATTASIYSWAVPLWLIFQLPLALLGLAAMMVGIAIETAIRDYAVAKPDDGILTYAFKTVVGAVLEAGTAVVGYITGLFGIDLSILNPLNIFLALHLVLVGYAIILLFAIFLIYKLRFMNPLFGSGGGMKTGAFLLALVGYSVPILNLFPWFVPWTVTVFLHPK